MHATYWGWSHFNLLQCVPNAVLMQIMISMRQRVGGNARLALYVVGNGCISRICPRVHLCPDRVTRGWLEATTTGALAASTLW